MMLIHALLAMTTITMFGDEIANDHEREWQRRWTSIRQVGAGESPALDATDDEWLRYYARMQNRCMEISLEAIRKTDGDHVMWARFLADQFGRYGNDADVRWFCATIYFAPGTRLVRKPEGELDVGLRESQLAFADEFVKRLVSDRKVFIRYYRMSLWGNEDFLGTGKLLDANINRLAARLQDAMHDDHSYYAMEFLLLAHAISRDDLVDGFKLGDLESRVGQLKETSSRQLFLTMDHRHWKANANEAANQARNPPPDLRLPSQPFDDWKQPAWVPVFEP